MTEPAHDLLVFMEQITAEMASEYGRIYSKSAEDPGTAGDEGEENWAQLFREWLPPTYHIETKGRLISHDGRLSRQIDVLVLKPSYPKKLLEKKVWLADGVAAAFECKNTLTAKHVSDSVARCAEFKSLFAPRVGTSRRELRSKLIYGILAHSHSWKSPNSEPIDNVQKALDAASATLQHPRDLIDLICVADLATWHVTYISSYDATHSPAAAHLETVFNGARGPMTTHICASVTTENQKSAFRPIGAMINALTTDIAWSDPATRGLADYFRKANLPGSGSGGMRPWSVNVYSDDVKARILAGYFTNGVEWDEWTIAGM